MTVVSPSLTRSVVTARCVLIGGGLPGGTLLKSGVAFSRKMFMITVPAAVICGVTFNCSAASLNAIVTVLFETV